MTVFRRTGKHRSGRPKKMSDDLMNEMLNPKNLVRDQSYEILLKHFHIDATRRTLQSAFNHRIPRVSRFKKARIRTLSQKNKKLRIQYEKDHEHHTVVDY
jgi:hypothetical protein